MRSCDGSRTGSTSNHESVEICGEHNATFDPGKVEAMMRDVASKYKRKPMQNAQKSKLVMLVFASYKLHLRAINVAKTIAKVSR